MSALTNPDQRYPIPYQALERTVLELRALVKRIQDALGTAEEGDGLVEVARDAHNAEQELAGILNAQEEFTHDD